MLSNAPAATDRSGVFCINTAFREDILNFPVNKPLGLYILIFAILFSLLLFPSVSFNDILYNSILNYLHIPAFLFLTLLTYKILICFPSFRKMRTHILYLITAASSFLSGLTAEIVQIGIDRDADIMDLIRNTAGIAGGIIVIALCIHADKGRMRRVLISFLILILTVPGLKPALLSYVYFDNFLSFPVICDFESINDRFQVKSRYSDTGIIPVPNIWRSNPSKRLLVVNFSKDTKYPGIQINGPFYDWSEYDSLKLSVFLLNRPAENLHIRIDDNFPGGGWKNRFSQRFQILNGENHISIPVITIQNAPKTHKMDLKKIERIIIFIQAPKNPVSLLVDNLCLK